MLQSHTATQQWQSFEMRMRQRRVERCLLRASVAIEASVLEDAREAIDEVRRLSPDEPALEQIAAQLAEAERLPFIEQLPDLPLQLDVAPPLIEATPAISEGEGHRFPFVAAAAFLVTVGGGGAWWWSTTQVAPAPAQIVTTPTIPSSESQTVPAAAAPAPAVHIDEASTDSLPFGLTAARPDAPSTTPLDAPPVPAGAQTDPRTITRGEAASAQANAVSERSAAGTPASNIGNGPELRAGYVDTRNSPPVRLPGAEMTPTVPAPPTIPARVEPLANLPADVETAPRVVAGADGIGEPAETPRATPTAPAAPDAGNPAPGVHPDEQGVRAALSRYESAYTRLDAAAAASVWPNVNQRALAAAFEGLSAQTISLERCDVRINGATAHAECAGTARWTPKVGGGTKTAARQWRFDLRNTNGDWVITQATAK